VFLDFPRPSREGECFLDFPLPSREGECFLDFPLPSREGECFLDFPLPSREGVRGRGVAVPIDLHSLYSRVMRLYLARHGDATTPTENPKRPLSAKGRQQVERMASFLARGRVKPARFVNSGKLRAVETAAILAKTLNPRAVMEEGSGLQPHDPVGPLVEAANAWAADAAETGNGDVMVVGHLPFMARAVAALVGAGAGTEFADFATGSVACLEPDAGTRWRLVWFLSPELLGG